MRLLYLKNDGSLAFTDDIVKEDEVPKYAVLSHTWRGKSEEVKFEDVVNGYVTNKSASHEKIQFCGKQAAKDGLEYFWVDTCCIDQDSSAEVGEAVTRMYQWYHNAARCYVYLTDVSVSENEINAENEANSLRSWEKRVRKSRWFTRGWTLQELLAPIYVEFFSVQGTWLGDKHSLRQCIHDATGIPHGALRGESLTNFTLRERLSWAKDRQTTREEDKAYSLLGILGLFMPLMYGEGDNAFTRLKAALAEKQAEMEHVLNRLPVSLSAAFNSQDNQDGPMCLDNTRVEVLRDIRSWADGSHGLCVFWLNGITGTGKSTIARTIARQFSERGQLGGSFFFSRGGVGRADRLFTTLASQLADRIAPTTRYICDAILEHKDISRQSLQDQWEQLIMNPLKKLDRNTSPRTIVLVIDALDECDNENHIRMILKLFSGIPMLEKIRLRIFITSRPEAPIRHGFQKIGTKLGKEYVLHDIPRKLVDRDITSFFEENFQEIRDERDLPHDWPGEEVVPDLVQLACGLFIWASIACRYIREGKGVAKSRIDRLLKVNGRRAGAGPEKQLDQIYITVLRDSIPADLEPEEREELNERRKKVLGTIAVQFAPLSVDSLAILLEYEPEIIKETLADLHTIINIPRENNRPIYLHHPTFREFLLDKSRSQALDFEIDETEMHNSLAGMYVRLMSKTLKQNICDLESPGVLVKDIEHNHIERCIPPELQYACLYWVEHYRRGGKVLCDGDDAHCFFKKHFLHWLEAVSLMRKGSELGATIHSGAIIRMYDSLLTPASNVEQKPFVGDARRFIFSFHSRIEQAPLQIYCAALAFIPPDNKLRHHFWSQKHGWLKDARVAEVIAPEVRDDFNYVNDIVFTPDGKHVASGSLGNSVRIWNTATKGALTKIQRQTEKISSVAISPDGTLLASGSDDATVMLCDIKSKTSWHPNHIMTGHSRWVNTVSFSLNGELLASGSMDETIRLWDTASGKEIKMFKANLKCINSIAFSPDCLTIASGTSDHMILLWDIQKGEIYMTLDGHSGAVNSVQFSADGKQIVSGSDDQSIRIWDVKRGAEIRVLKGHSKRVCAVTFSKDAQFIASGSEDQSIKVWNASKGELIATLNGHTSGVNAVAYSQDGKYLASASFNDEARLWNAHTAEQHGKLADFGLEDQSELSLTTRLAHTNTNDRTVSCLLVSPDGQSIASGSHDTAVIIWKNGGENRLTLRGHSGRINQLTFAPRQPLIASASEDASVKIWDTDSCTIQHTLNGHSNGVRLIRISPNGRLLLSCSNDETFKLWDIETGTALRAFEGHVDQINDIAFSPDGALIASCSADMTVRLWDVESGTEVCDTMNGHIGSVNSVAFSSDGELLATGSSDNTVRIWKSSGIPCVTLTGHTGSINSAAFSKDTSLVISCSEDETVRIWGLAEQIIKEELTIGCVVRTASFSDCERYIETNKGVLRREPSCIYSRRSASQSTSTVFVLDDWVMCDMEKALWLPDGYSVTTVATWDGRAVLGHASGAVSFLKF